ncbi:hypothetical protein ABXW85_24130, partial [Streptococcus suis]
AGTSQLFVFLEMADGPAQRQACRKATVRHAYACTAMKVVYLRSSIHIAPVATRAQQLRHLGLAQDSLQR